MSNTLKQQIQEDVKNAMRAREQDKLGALRLITAAIKQREVDERIENMDDTQVLAILDKMLKQRRESISQYEQAGRQELADKEAFECELIKQYLPEQLSPEVLSRLISEAIQQTAAESMKDMGKVMAILKPQLQGRADMSEVSKLIKQHLS